MNGHHPGSWNLHFSLWNIPITIEPTTWLLLALLGGVFGVDDLSSLTPVLLFILFGIICLLTHELGHALSARFLYGDTPTIVLGNLGGVTQHSTLAPRRWQEFLVVLAGPFATLLPGIAGALLLGTQLHDYRLAFGLFVWYPLPTDLPEHLIQGLNLHLSAGAISIPVFLGYIILFSISVWWCLFNLIPIFPLDGGRLLGALARNWKLVHITGIMLSLALLVLSLYQHLWFNVLLTFYLAYINFLWLRRLSR